MDSLYSQLTTSSENSSSNEAANQEPLMPGFEAPALPEPVIVAKLVADADELPNAEDFEWVATNEYENRKTGQRFVWTEGTLGGTLYSPGVGSV